MLQVRAATYLSYPFPVMLSVLSSGWCYQLHLRDPAVRFLNMQLMWPFRRAVIHLPNLLIRRVWMILPFPPFWDMYANRPCFIHAWWDECQCQLLLKWAATGNFMTLLGNFKRRGTSEDPSICNKYAKYIFKTNNINGCCNKATVKHARQILVLDNL